MTARDIRSETPPGLRREAEPLRSRASSLPLDEPEQPEAEEPDYELDYFERWGTWPQERRR